MVGMNLKLPEAVKKYRYVILVLVLGLVLMAIPNHTTDTGTTEPPAPEPEKGPTVSETLSALLGQIDGVGRVKVMLTIAAGEETVYQTDASSGSTTVIITDGSRNQQGLVRQVNPPVYLGAVVVCQGAADPVVRLAVTEAVSKITGLGMDRISVLKMK